jgi:hypothetical protein
MRRKIKLRYPAILIRLKIIIVVCPSLKNPKPNRQNLQLKNWKYVVNSSQTSMMDLQALADVFTLYREYPALNHVIYFLNFQGALWPH